jgi:hypothetical protein
VQPDHTSLIIHGPTSNNQRCINANTPPQAFVPRPRPRTLLVGPIGLLSPSVRSHRSLISDMGHSHSHDGHAEAFHFLPSHAMRTLSPAAPRRRAGAGAGVGCSSSASALSSWHVCRGSHQALHLARLPVHLGQCSVACAGRQRRRSSFA